jgi:3-hydroxyacyl-CoA dehydrogenase
MFYADQVGLKHIADRLSYYAKETNDPSLEPAPLLKRLAAEGKTFASLAEKAKAA